MSRVSGANWAPSRSSVIFQLFSAIEPDTYHVSRKAKMLIRTMERVKGIFLRLKGELEAGGI
jgi:hypothetical protein